MIGIFQKIEYKSNSFEKYPILDFVLIYNSVDLGQLSGTHILFFSISYVSVLQNSNHSLSHIINLQYISLYTSIIF